MFTNFKKDKQFKTESSSTTRNLINFKENLGGKTVLTVGSIEELEARGWETAERRALETGAAEQRDSRSSIDTISRS